MKVGKAGQARETHEYEVATKTGKSLKSERWPSQAYQTVTKPRNHVKVNDGQAKLTR